MYIYKEYMFFLTFLQKTVSLMHKQVIVTKQSDKYQYSYNKKS